MQNDRGRYPVRAETTYVNQFVVQLGLLASLFDEGKFSFPSSCQQNAKAVRAQTLYRACA